MVKSCRHMSVHTTSHDVTFELLLRFTCVSVCNNHHQSCSAPPVMLASFRDTLWSKVSQVTIAHVHCMSSRAKSAWKFVGTSTPPVMFASHMFSFDSVVVHTSSYMFDIGSKLQVTQISQLRRFTCVSSVFATITTSRVDTTNHVDTTSIHIHMCLQQLPPVVWTPPIMLAPLRYILWSKMSHITIAHVHRMTSNAKSA